jgi:hypothetical protein
MRQGDEVAVLAEAIHHRQCNTPGVYYQLSSTMTC